MAGPTTTRRGAGRKPAGASARPVRRPPAPRAPRAPRRHRFGRRPLLLLAGVLLVVTGVLWLLYGSAWLRVDRVTVSGTRVLRPQEVTEVAAVRLGRPLAALDTDAVAGRLSRELPRVATVEVDREWPGTVALRVTERKPVLLLRKDDRYTEVDAGGVRFATSRQAPAGVPVLELTARARGIAARRFSADRLTREAVRVAGDLPAPVARATRTVRLASYDSITLELAGGRTVVWGSGENGGAKARALTALMKAAPGAAHFDVSAPTAPAVARS
ncbi:FtsQ-type POTRA domain-containing protein [Streptomyces sp. LP05-1]|uniref:Cell division protein FtsQ n=1 Tax=Streptomyces pyxinae TaxID=2970734 RepID=A0ABT2CG54_9ACTN|nr:FtsQ-type POTRA domain-containing protein [Streptomyces sp. LP05-1]MCS0636404.1 FtsQ-type POTRA domain-containing protein [Streptomyces sp. LP05-1]